MIELGGVLANIVFVDWDGITSEIFPVTAALDCPDFYATDYYAIQRGIKCRVYFPKPDRTKSLTAQRIYHCMKIKNDPRDLMEQGLL